MNFCKDCRWVDAFYDAYRDSTESAICMHDDARVNGEYKHRESSWMRTSGPCGQDGLLFTRR